MEAKEFYVFRSLLADVYAKAFGEQLSSFSHDKVRTLSRMICEVTGEFLSHRSLGNYIIAALEGDERNVDPTAAALSALAQYVAGDESRGGRHELRMGEYAAWYKYRGKVLARLLAA